MPAILCWLMLVFLAVPALALAETEAAPSGGPVLIEDEAPLEGYGAIPPGEEIHFEPASPVSPAPSGAVDPPPVTPAPVDPSTDPAPVDPIPPDPVGEAPVGETPVGEEPVGETPVDEPPVGSVIENSPEQQPADDGAYAPPVVAVPPVEIPVAAADPVPAEVIPTDLMRRVESQVPPAVEAPVPSTTPISRPSDSAARAATIPSAVLTTARPAQMPVPKPESHFATGRDLVRSAMPPAPPATPKRPDAELPGAGVGYDEAVNPFQTRLTSPLGPAPSGSQLFEVLAQYVIAGGSGPPTSVALILLVQIATVVAAFALRAPRSMFQIIMGAPDSLSVGYRAVALRPG